MPSARSTEHVERHAALPHAHAAQEFNSGKLDVGRIEGLLQHADDGLHLHVVGRHAVAHEAVRRGEPVEHLDAHRLPRGQQRGGRVQPGRARSDHRDPALSLLHVFISCGGGGACRSGNGPSGANRGGRRSTKEAPLSQVGGADEAVDVVVGALPDPGSRHAPDG
jgi:hypothetical protein